MTPSSAIRYIRAFPRGTPIDGSRMTQDLQRSIDAWEDALEVFGYEIGDEIPLDLFQSIDRLVSPITDSDGRWPDEPGYTGPSPLPCND